MKTLKEILAERAYELYISDHPNELSFDEFLIRIEREQKFKVTFVKYLVKARTDYDVKLTERINKGYLRDDSLLNSNKDLDNQ